MYIIIFVEGRGLKSGNRQTILSMEICNGRLHVPMPYYVEAPVTWYCNCNLPLPAVSMHGVATGISKTSNMEIRTREQRIQVFTIGRVSTFTLWHHRRSETKNITNMIVKCNINWFLAMYKYFITHNIWCKKNYILAKSKWPILLKVPQLKIYWCTQVASSRHT